MLHLWSEHLTCDASGFASEVFLQSVGVAIFFNGFPVYNVDEYLFPVFKLNFLKFYWDDLLFFNKRSEFL